MVAEGCEDTRAYLAQKKPITDICRELCFTKVVRNVIPPNATEFRYERKRQPILNICPR